MRSQNKWRDRIETKRESSLPWNLLRESHQMSKALRNSWSLPSLFLLKMWSSFARRASSSRSSYLKKWNPCRKMNTLNPQVLQWTFINILLSANPPNLKRNIKNRKWSEICHKVDSEGFPWNLTLPTISCSNIKPKRFKSKVVKLRQTIIWRHLMFSRRSKRDINRPKNTGLSINSYDLTIFIIYCQQKVNIEKQIWIIYESPNFKK